MEPKFIFAIAFMAALIIVIMLNRKYGVLTDESTSERKPYSFSRIQFAWWMLIIISAYITSIFAFGRVPDSNESTLVLIGLSGSTLAAARIIDVSDNGLPQAVSTLSRNGDRQGFFLDILSDNKGVSIHRLQALLFNLIFGGWFIYSIIAIVNDPAADVNSLFPELSPNNLMMLGLSSATYAALKSNENK